MIAYDRQLPWTPMTAPPVVLASALCKAEALLKESLGHDLYSGLAYATMSSYADLQKCLGLHTLHSCFVYLRHEQEPVQ